MAERHEEAAAHYLAYYELHEVPWKLHDKVVFQDKSSTLQIQIGCGPYTVPRFASPEVRTKAGGANISTVNENYVLEGATYIGVAIPTSRFTAGDALTVNGDWDKAADLADDIASCVSLCLSQWIAPQKVAEYVRQVGPEGAAKGMSFRWQVHSGARASVNTRSIGSIRRVLDRLLDEAIAGPTLVALRWHDQSKRVLAGPDRLVALWIALEALMGPVANHAELVAKTAQHLSLKKYRLGLSSQQICEALGLDRIREARNRIVHEGRREIPWPVRDSPERRDWPQILNDIVEEIARSRLHATPTTVLRKHAEQGMALLGLK